MPPGMLFRSRAPLRLGLAGGGTDVSPFCDLHGGYVLNATIDLYAYASVELLELPTIVFEAADHEIRFEGPADGRQAVDDRLALHRGVYDRIVRDFCAGNPFGVKLITHSDAPPGSGLGASSTLVVAMLHAFVEALNLPLGEYELAHLAYDIERVDLRLAGGKQDQYSASFGGVNFMEFGGHGNVLVNPLRIKPWIVSELESSLLLFFTGVSRESARIIDQQVRNVRDGARNPIDALLSVKDEALRMKAALLKGDFGAFVDSMRSSWESKKQTASSVSNSHIDEIYSAASAAGALAGKVSGAGGGGFMMFFVEPSAKPRVVKTLSAFAGQVFSCHFTKTGSQAWRVR
ncbi:MAG: dehydrogenase [Sterolibacteriaceae bacterium]|uniref:Dehydrogenase n=1 Tax=Candidatus Methylophosphatis roskildensis TaxID=2899263 RepID=A0A9D7DXT5_9PROT|nr:dehydrogenase [Candidatus Methylophosphatis roskildensis]MBK7237765.1 dehydrogenase [Sterolibacteriaceae bacterium]MBK7665033.1 dehydrogenase [Sterolibacteriaceae bacterium]MBK9085296.1 dehydrogenase [Sterolibacteriaceae bacterium]